MTNDEKLVGALAESARNFTEKVPVFAIEPRGRERHEADVAAIASRFCDLHGIGPSRTSLDRNDATTTIHLSEGARAKLYAASGAFELTRGWEAHQLPISDDADKLDRARLTEQATSALAKLELDRLGNDEKLEFERLWLIKSTGADREQGAGRVRLERAVGAFRRQLAGLPVWGRASAFAMIAAEGQLASAGVDWRYVTRDPIDSAVVLDPADAARQVVRELDGFHREGRANLDRYVPEMFSLGYFSLPKRRSQSVMQPVWVAMLRGQGRLSVNRLIVIPAADKLYEPIDRIIARPPGEGRAEPRVA